MDPLHQRTAAERFRRQFGQLDQAAVSGTLYPSGFTNLITNGVLGSPFTNTAGAPALNLTDATLVLSGGNLAGGALTFTNINLTGNTLTNLAKERIWA